MNAWYDSKVLGAESGRLRKQMPVSQSNMTSRQVEPSS
jgi:hypothetical protein